MSENQTDIRLAARDRGEKTFYTGTVCKRGHYARRYTSNGGCIECIHGKFSKPLKQHQEKVVQRYRFECLLPAPNVLPLDVHGLTLALAKAAYYWEYHNGVAGGVNNWAAKIQWAEQHGKPIGECPIK